jgi:hypothetical protein
MPREEDCIISLPTYRQYWVHTKPYGHDIVIWSDTGKITIQCKWPDMIWKDLIIIELGQENDY